MKNSTTSLLLAGAIAATAFLALPAAANEAGDIVIRAGLATVNPDGNNGPVAQVDNAQGLGLSLTYMVTQNLGVELLGASPFKHDINLASSGDQIGETKHLPPTLLLNYHFQVAGPISAYVGAGLNHTFFFEEQIDSAVADDLDLDSSTGLALQFGTDFHLTEHCSVNLAWWYLDIDTDATLTAADGSQSKAKVEIDPGVVMLGAAYTF